LEVDLSEMTLVIADKNYSLWPLPAWLCLRSAKLPFREVLIRFGQPDTREQMLRHGPTGRVPVLKHGALTLWDSLAICEYVADLKPEAKLWPGARAARGVARSFAAEMHGTGGDYPGAVRRIIYSLDTNVRRRTARVRPSPEAQESIDHLTAQWRFCRENYGQDGPFLFGHFTIADAMTAHLVNRFVTYDIGLPDHARAYCAALRAHPPLAEWVAQAEAEDWILPSAEIEV
jgi:glutathione S-transferase